MVGAMVQNGFESSGGRLVSTSGEELPLKAVDVSADAKGGLARVTLKQRFYNPHEEPLAVTYTLGLPADAAVSGFAFTIGEERVVGEVDKKNKARERFERAIVEGRTASLLEQERSGVFTQKVGNVPPRSEVLCEVTLDQKLIWNTEGAWEWRFPTCVAPRYLGSQGRVVDAEKITVDVADGPLAVALSVALEVRDAASKIESPSHRVTQTAAGAGMKAELDKSAAATVDRDIVMRWPVATPKVGVTLDVAKLAKGALEGSAFGLLTLVPPSRRVSMPVRRDLIVLLDTSGSMSGEPLDQARRITSALIDTLSDDDTLELIEFSNSARRWKSKAVDANEKNKRQALSWLASLRASGGTEMRTGIYEALAPLDDEAQRQVIVVTDGQIGFEDEVIRTISEKCPAACRVHTVGVGSGVNRSLTAPAARAGRGAEVVISLGEDPERAARRLVARTDAPTVVDVELSGSALLEHAPKRIPDLYGASPAMVALKLRPEGGTLIVRGRTAEGEYLERLEVPEISSGGSGALAALFAREKVEDLELEHASGHASAELDQRIETLGLVHQISTRLTSWVAVSEKITVDPTAPTRQQTMPQALPHGMSVGGLGLRPAMAPPPRMAGPMLQGAPASAAAPSPAPAGGAVKSLSADVSGFGGMAPDEKAKKKEAFEPSRSRVTGAPPRKAAPPPPPRIEAPAETEAEMGELDEGAPAVDAFAEAQAERKEDAKLQREQNAPAKPKPGVGATGGKDKGGVPTWFARIVLRSGNELVLEVTAGDERLWDPSQPIELVLEDGSTLTLTADPARSTRALQTRPGLVLRVAFALPEGATAKPVAMKIGSMTVMIRG
jgi:Ca-activated chloride channel family protein